MSNNSGKGNNNGPKSADEQTEIRRAKKKLQQSRVGAGKHMHGDSFVGTKITQENREILFENKLCDAVDFAHALLSDLTSATKAKVKATKEVVNGKPEFTEWYTLKEKKNGKMVVATKPAFGTNTIKGMEALLDFLFEDSEENKALAEAFPVTGRLIHLVRVRFVFACELFFLGYDMRKKYDWYGKIADGSMLRSQVRSYRWQLKQAANQVA